MSAAPTPPTVPPADPPSGGAQVALGVFLAVLLALLAFRGYGTHFGMRPTEPVAADRTDLNAADQTELAQVPGVGPKLAERIVAHRREHGPFRSVDELRGVRGVGPATFDKVRHRFRAGDGPPEPDDGVRPEVTSTSFSSPVRQTPANPPPAPKPASGGVRKVQPGDPPINVNTATPDELQRLPGVGPVMAGAIVAARTAKPFESVDDLDRVKGIGPKTLDKLRPFVTVR